MKLATAQFSVDSSGRPRVDFAEEGADARLLKAFFESDLQDPSYAENIVGEARRQLRTHGGRRWHCTGNSHSISVGPRTTILRALHPSGQSASRAMVCTRDLVGLIKRWLSLA